MSIASGVVREARQFSRRLRRRSTIPATPSVAPNSVTDACAVAVDGRPTIPSTALASRADPALEPLGAAPLCAPFARSSRVPEAVDGVAPPCVVHGLLKSFVGDGPADALAPRHVDPEGVPEPPLLSAPFAEKSSE